MNAENRMVVQQFLRDHQLSLAARTLDTYKKTAEAFFAFAATPYHSVRPADIRMWLAHLTEN